MPGTEGSLKGGEVCRIVVVAIKPHNVASTLCYYYTCSHDVEESSEAHRNR